MYLSHKFEVLCNKSANLSLITQPRPRASNFWASFRERRPTSRDVWNSHESRSRRFRFRKILKFLNPDLHHVNLVGRGSICFIYLFLFFFNLFISFMILEIKTLGFLWNSEFSLKNLQIFERRNSLNLCLKFVHFYSQNCRIFLFLQS